MTRSERTRRFRARLIACGVSGLAVAVSAPAFANCTPRPAPAQGTVLCTGTDPDPLRLDANGTTVTIEPTASVASIIVTRVYPAGERFPSGNGVTINANGAITGGLTVDAGALAPGAAPAFGASLNATLNVGSGGSIGGARAIQLQVAPGLPSGAQATMSITNSGTIRSNSGPAIVGAGTQPLGVLSLVNRATGTIGGIAVTVRTLDNAGTIDGGAVSALSLGYSNAFGVFPASLTNSGTMRSSGSTATIALGGAFFFPYAATNSGTITNTGTGDAIALTGNVAATITNAAGATINADRGRAIVSTNAIRLTNRGTINGAIVSTAVPQFAGQQGSIIDTVGGTINGSVTLGATDDTVIVGFTSGGNLLSSITGGVNPGAGIDTLQVDFVQNTTLTAPVSRPAPFERLSFGLANDVALTLGQGFSNSGAPVAIAIAGAQGSLGTARLINQAALTAAGPVLSLPLSANIGFRNEATITATLARSFDTAVTIPFSGQFANTGTITANGGNGVDVSSFQPVINSGTIIADQTALRSFNGVLDNSGRIESRQGLAVELTGNVGVQGRNSGTIIGATGARTSIALTNSGTITGLRGPGVDLQSNGALFNLAGGVVNGGVLASGGFSANATVSNAGTINGNVDFGALPFAFGSNNVFVAQPGGIVTGSLRLGSGFDTFVTTLTTGGNPFAGVAGTITGGPNSTLRYLVSADTTATAAAPSGIFTRVGYALANNARLTLTGGALSTALSFSGSGTVDLTATITGNGTATLINLDDTFVLPNTPRPAPTALQFTHRGTLSVVHTDATRPTDAAVRVGTGSSFTNVGTITVTERAPNPFGAPLTGIASSGRVVNEGTIAVGGSGAIGISGTANFTATPGSITNSGAISQIAGTAAASGIVSGGTITNTGTIAMGGSAISFTGPGPHLLTNSGTLSSTGAVAVRGDAALGVQVVNTATGRIAGAATAPAIVLPENSRLDNAGTIVGDVVLGPNRPFVTSGSTYIARGGTIAGNLIFGSGNDTLVVIGESTGVSGRIDGGSGVDTFIRGFTSSATVDAGSAALIPATFERLGLGAVGREVTVTVTGPAAGLAQPLTLFGDGSIVNRAAISGSGNPFGARNNVLINTIAGLNASATGLSFTNEAAIGDGVFGTVRSFTNAGTIGNANTNIATSLNAAPGEEAFAFLNSGTILGLGSANFFNPAVLLSPSTVQNAPVPMLRATLDNQGGITGGMFAAVNAADLSFRNSGRIAATAVGTPSVSAVSLTQTAAGDTPTAALSFLNSGTIAGTVDLLTDAATMTVTNSNAITGSVAITQNRASSDAPGLTSATLTNSGTLTATAGRAALALTSEARAVTIVNSGPVVTPLQNLGAPNIGVGPHAAISIDALTPDGNQTMFTNTGTVTNAAVLGSGVVVSVLTGATAPQGEPQPPRADAAITIVNSAAVRANGGAVLGDVTPCCAFPPPAGVPTVSLVTGLGAFAEATGSSRVSITNTAEGIIEATGALRRGFDTTRPSERPTYAPVAGAAAGFGSIALTAIGDAVRIVNAGAITGGPGGTLADGQQASTGLIDPAGSATDTAAFFPDRFIAGAIQTFASTDEVINSGTITGSVDLGGGNDSVTNTGAIVGNVFLRAGDDVFRQSLINRAALRGTVDGGAGIDALVVLGEGGTGQTFDLAAFSNFETLTLTGRAPIDRVGLGGALPFATVQLDNAGLAVAAGGTLTTRGPVAVTGSSGADGVFNRGTIGGGISLGDGDDQLDNGGIIAGPIALGAGDDRLIWRSGARFAETAGGAGTDTVVLSLSGTEAAPDALSFASFREFERLRHETGVATLGGTAGFGAIDIVGGRLIGLAGSVIGGGTITIAPGATFGSAGVVNAAIVNNGTLAPGASPGTMTVNGNVAFAAGSTAAFELTPTATDRLVVNGAVTIAAGTTLALTGARPITPGAPLDLITASGGITGSFAAITKPSSIVGFFRQQKATLQLLGLFPTSGSFAPQTARTIDYVNAVLTAGQAGPALLDALPTLVDPAGNSNAAAFAQLNAESYASSEALATDSSLAVVHALRDLPRAPGGDGARWFGFARGVSQWRTLRGDTGLGTSTAEQQNFGLIGGIGFGSAHAMLGTFIGHVEGQQSIAGLGARTTSSGIAFGVVGRLETGPLQLRGTVSFEDARASLSRAVPVGTRAAARFDRRSWAVDLAAAYRFALSRSWALEPNAAFTHVSTQRGSAQESGGPFALTVAGHTLRSSIAEAGVALRGGQQPGATWRPWAEVQLRTALAGRLSTASGGFAGAAQLTVPGIARPRTSAVVGAGFEVDIAPAARFSAGYRQEAIAGGSATAQAGLSVSF